MLQHGAGGVVNQIFADRAQANESHQRAPRGAQPSAPQRKHARLLLLHVLQDGPADVRRAALERQGINHTRARASVRTLPRAGSLRS